MRALTRTRPGRLAGRPGRLGRLGRHVTWLGRLVHAGQTGRQAQTGRPMPRVRK